MGRIEPLNGYVLVEVDKAKDTSDGGIVLPETARGLQSMGTVAAVGPDAKVAKGDRVLFKRHSGHDVTSASDTKLIHADDLLAVLREEG